MRATWMKALLATLGALAALLLLTLTGASAADDAWRVGYLHSLSGYLANMGTASRDGFLLAIDEINKRGGIDGRPLQVFVENDESEIGRASCRERGRTWEGEQWMIEENGGRCSTPT